MRYLALALVAISGQAAAQADPAPSTIQVVGSGKATTPPDRALIDYWVAGEGRTPDAASAALAEKHKAVTRGLSGLLGARTTISSGNVILIETRSPGCQGPNSYGAQPQLSEGVCAVTGYLATLQGSVQTGTIAKAGTAVGLAARMGARDARLQQFTLADPSDAQRRATADALADARKRAETLATGSGAKLGPVVSIRDQNSGMAMMAFVPTPPGMAPPPPPSPPPVDIDVSPRPIETQAQVYVTYAILP